MANSNDAWWDNVKVTAKFLSVFFAAGLIFVWLDQTIQHGARSASPWAALLWALACLALGALLGFLFGIPRSLQDKNGQPAVASVAPAATTAEGTQPANVPGIRSWTDVNTNLEQISDWLTKIIVGATLVQLQKIPETVSRISAFIARSLGGPDQQFFAGALLVYFIILGFLGSYLLTRLYLQPLFARAATLPISEATRAEILSAPVAITTGAPTLPTGTDNAVQQLLKVPLTELTSLSDVYVVAKAHLAAKNYTEAIRGFIKALELAPNDINIRIDYALALRAAGTPLPVVVDELLEARKRLTPQTDRTTKERLYRALVYTLVYMEPPQGFTEAIKYGEEYLADRSNPNDGGIFVTLAAAYGQKYEWEREHEGDGTRLEEARKKALGAVQCAIDTNPDWKEKLKALLDPDYRGKDPGENDLEVFADDDDFRSILDLPPVKEKPATHDTQVSNAKPTIENPPEKSD